MGVRKKKKKKKKKKNSSNHMYLTSTIFIKNGLVDELLKFY